MDASGLDQALEHLRLAVGPDGGVAAQVALPLRGLLGEDVALVRLGALHLPGPGDREALLRALVRLHLLCCDLRSSDGADNNQRKGNR